MIIFEGMVGKWFKKLFFKMICVKYFCYFKIVFVWVYCFGVIWFNFFDWVKNFGELWGRVCFFLEKEELRLLVECDVVLDLWFGYLVCFVFGIGGCMSEIMGF